MKTLESQIQIEGHLRRDNPDDDRDMEHFLQQIEGDREMRQNMNLYKRKEPVKKAVEKDAMDEEDDEDDEYVEDDEEVRLDELLDDMSLNSDLDEELEEEERRGKVISAAEATKTVQFQLPSDASTSTFDASKFDPSTFKFV